MKKVLIVLSISFLLSSCLVIKVYEAPKSKDQAPKHLRTERKMISSDLTLPFPKEGTEILFFGDDQGSTPELIHRDHSIVKMAYSEDDSTQNKVVVIKIDKDDLDLENGSSMHWQSKGGMSGKRMIFIAKDSISLPLELEKAMGGACKMDATDCSTKMASCTHHTDLNASEDALPSKEKNVFIIKSKQGDSSVKPVIIIDGEVQAENYDMNAIDPDNIESINVLKGESAFEKLGERGANGIIMIQMKKN